MAGLLTLQTLGPNMPESQVRLVQGIFEGTGLCRGRFVLSGVSASSDDADNMFVVNM